MSTTTCCTTTLKTKSSNHLIIKYVGQRDALGTFDVKIILKFQCAKNNVLKHASLSDKNIFLRSYLIENRDNKTGNYFSITFMFLNLK